MAAKKRTEDTDPSILRNYWTESSRPLVSLVFVAPMLLAYEFGLLLLGPGAMRNGADVWLRELLGRIGLTQYFLLPVATCAVLLSWHHIKRERWQVAWSVLYGMFLECLALSVGLMLLAHLQGLLLAFSHTHAFLATGTSPGPTRFLAFLGAGIYEELLFRLMLVPALAAIARGTGASRTASLVFAVIAASLLFAAAHYRVNLLIGSWHVASSFGDSFDLTSFAFRTIAGAFFCVLFWYRGFGVAAGTHALYDILVAATP